MAPLVQDVVVDGGVIGGLLDAGEVERVLSAAALQGADHQNAPNLVAVVNPPRIVWASPEAKVIFNASGVDRLSRLVFGSASSSRGMAGRLSRLNPGDPPHLERLLVSSAFRIRPLTLLCRAVDSQDTGRVIILHVGPLAAAPASPAPAALVETVPDEEFVPSADQSLSLADETELVPSEAGPEPDEAEAEALEPERPVIRDLQAVAADLALRFGKSRVRRFIWQTDADGVVTAIGPELAACVGDTGLRLQVPLVTQLHAVAPDAATLATAAMTQGRSWSDLRVSWPVGESSAAIGVVLGGVPRLEPTGGYRGFGVVHLEQLSRRDDAGHEESDSGSLSSDEYLEERIQPDAGLDSTGGSDAVDEEEEILGLDEPVAIHEPVDDADPVVLERHIDSDRQSPPEETLVAPVVPLPETEEGRPPRSAWSPMGSSRFDAGVGPAKVVHLAAFKSGTGQSPVQQNQRPMPSADPDGFGSDEVLEAPPRWSETPPAEPSALEPPEQRLSSNERYNFDEIARTLAASPTRSDATSASPVATAQDNEAAEAAEPPPTVLSGSAPEAVVAISGNYLSPSAAALLDSLPIGTLVVSDLDLVYANRTILDLLGFDGLAGMRDAGGLTQLFQGQSIGWPSATAAPNPVSIMGRDGDAIGVDVRSQAIEWQGKAATLISIRRALDKDVGAQIEAIKLEFQKSQATARDLAEALDMAASGIGFLDLGGRILSINAGAERLFGYDQREVVGDRCSLLLAPDQQTTWATFFNGFTASQSGGRTTAFRRFAGRKRNGDLMRLAASLKRVGDDKICIVWNDDSNRHVTESELEAARREAERASSLKSEFLAKVSHEIRTPLNAILGFTEIIVDERFGPIGNDRYKEYLKDIHASGTHVMSLINDLLDLSRIEAGGLDLKLVAINPNAIVGESVATLQSQAHRERIIIRSSLAPRLPLILADERALRQIVLNLLSNAVKFNEPGGQVIVSTAVMETGAVAIRIRDTGLGMSDEEIETAMKPFRQLATPKANAGSGLGLPLTKALVEANQATMTIKSRPREGTLVEVVFKKSPVAAVSVPAE